MCGICGIFGEENRSKIRAMCKSISHRGPDDSGTYLDRRISLGHQRLSIIDLSRKGRQPMTNEDGDIIIVYNGEIYNYKELRQELINKGHRFFSETDTEVVIHAYEEYGCNCLDMFNGFFAFAIYDCKKKNLFLARDRLGIKPLYYTFKDGKLYFASEIKSLLVCPEIKRVLNPEAFNSYFTFRANTGEETFFRSIYKLLPGHFMVYDGKSVIRRRYWGLRICVQKKSISFHAKKIRKELSASVERRLMGDVPLGVYLSGGIDSSSIVALMKPHVDKIRTFSVQFDFPELNQDIKSAEYIASHFETEHKTLTVKSDIVKLLPEIVSQQDEPSADSTTIPIYVLSQFAKKQGVSIALLGEGSDEIFCGYEQFKLLRLYNRIRVVPRTFKSVLAPLASATPDFILNRFFKYAGSLGKLGISRFRNYLLAKRRIDAYLEVISVFNEKEKRKVLNYRFKTDLAGKLHDDHFRHHSSMNAAMELELKNTLVDDYLMKIDKNTMSHAVEARVPFLDHKLVEAAFRIPVSYKLNGFNEKVILRKAMHNDLPKKILTKKKDRFFVPINHWFDHELKDFAKQILEKKELHLIFNSKYIDKINRGLRNSKLYYLRQLWCLMIFQLWHEKFIANQDVSL